jgi:hypothetical protein
MPYSPAHIDATTAQALDQADHAAHLAQLDVEAQHLRATSSELIEESRRLRAECRALREQCRRRGYGSGLIINAAAD